MKCTLEEKWKKVEEKGKKVEEKGKTKILNPCIHRPKPETDYAGTFIYRGNFQLSI